MQRIDGNKAFFVALYRFPEFSCELNSSNNATQIAVVYSCKMVWNLRLLFFYLFIISPLCILHLKYLVILSELICCPLIHPEHAKKAAL